MAECTADAVIAGSKPIVRALYEADVPADALHIADTQYRDEYGYPDIPSLRPVKSHKQDRWKDRRKDRRQRQYKSERKASAARMKRAKNVYGRSWYLSSAQMRLLVVIWAGSCLLVSSSITIGWLILIERLGLN
jgi:hypothetical protein